MDSQKTSDKGDKRRRRLKRPRFQMRISTRYAPRKATNGEPLTCTSETTLKPEQLLDLYRYLKLTRLVEERLVNLYLQTIVAGGLSRSLHEEGRAGGAADAPEAQVLITSLLRAPASVLVI